MMQVTLSDPIIEVTGWTPDLDKLGAYTYKRRKTPEEIREEKIERRNRFGEDAWKVSQIESIPMTCLSKDETKPGVCYFLPGLWPRVREYFDTHGLQYTVVDKRNPDIRPPLDMSAFDGVDFRETQDVAVALISSLDCGVIETTTGYGKCLDPDTPVVRYNGSIAKAREIHVGDVLMGDDSTPRQVLSTCAGRGPLYRFVPSKGDIHVFNDKHVMSLVVSGARYKLHIADKAYENGDTVDIAVEDYIRLSNNIKHLLKAKRAGVVCFRPRQKPVLNPYFVGLYLGDGTGRCAEITNPDPEVIDFCSSYARTVGWVAKIKHSRKLCPCLRFTTGAGSCKKNAPIISIRKACGLNNKGAGRRITNEYKFGSPAVRRSLLAGLIDSDGYNNRGCYELSTKYDTLAEDILFVARSLGLAAYDKIGKLHKRFAC